MKVRSIDLNFLNYINELMKVFVLKNSFNIKNYKNSIKIAVINFNYNIFFNLKNLSTFKFQILNDITVVNYPDLSKSLELNYFF